MIRFVADRLKEGYSVEDLKRAIDGNKIDHWHAENRKHGLDYVFRNPTKVDDFIELIEKPNKGKGNGKTNVDQYGNWIPQYEDPQYLKPPDAQEVVYIGNEHGLGGGKTFNETDWDDVLCHFTHKEIRTTFEKLRPVNWTQLVDHLREEYRARN
jgi:hypothetical protein